jgi:hypothetical protein
MLVLLERLAQPALKVQLDLPEQPVLKALKVQPEQLVQPDQQAQLALLALAS